MHIFSLACRVILEEKMKAGNQAEALIEACVAVLDHGVIITYRNSEGKE